MPRRIQRSEPLPTAVRRVDKTPSASVPGRREIVADAPVQARANLRSAAHAGAAVASVYGGGIAEAPDWSGPDGAAQGLGRISTNQPRRGVK